jgi:predicted CoA-substrate-specific enzyme activase
MNALGIDVGSLTTKVAIFKNGTLASSVAVASGEDAAVAAKEAADKALGEAGLNFSDLYAVATGIGAKSAAFSQQQKAFTTCLARGTSYLFPSVRMVIDIGAETSTVVKLNEKARVKDWANQDKCAAGTGIFLQQMAKIIEVPLEKMSELSQKAKSKADISATCAVFAESEVISYVHRDPPTPKEDIVAGIYFSVISRIMALCKRLGIEKDVALTGGVALNRGLVDILERELGFKVLVPEKPQFVAAIGAAILAKEAIEKETA